MKTEVSKIANFKKNELQKSEIKNVFGGWYDPNTPPPGVVPKKPILTTQNAQSPSSGNDEPNTTPTTSILP